jgi:hypothetical protein
MNRLSASTTTVACLLALAAPVQANELQRSLVRFCSAIRQINQNGFSAAPGTPAAQLIVSGTEYGPSEYRTVWTFARSSNALQCRSIW